MGGYYFVKYKFKQKNILFGITFYTWRKSFDCVFIKWSEHGIYHTDKLVASLQRVERVEIESVVRL